MSIDRGDIVLVTIPDTSGRPGKTRPALVVSANHNNYRLQDAIVALITSTTSRVKTEATQYLIEIASTEGKQSGLLHDSVVKCERLHAVLQSIFRKKIGSLSAVAMQQIDGCLKAALDLT